jgi:hypothetical protein
MKVLIYIWGTGKMLSPSKQKKKKKNQLASHMKSASWIVLIYMMKQKIVNC